MPANVVAFSVQTGSGGFTVAHRVSDQLGFRYYDWEITSEAASRAGVTPNEVIAAERVPGFLERMMRRLGAVSTVSLEGSPGFSEPSPAMYNAALAGLTSDDYRQFMRRWLWSLPIAGRVIVAMPPSTCANAGVLRVLIYGSATLRAERLASDQGLEMEKAKATVKQSDKDRGELLKRVYHFDWLDSGMYDLALNTDHLSLDFATDVIISAAREWP
jgi:cytidylate kinase